ncbi:Asp-tRNA(Asn)/Glu-tRNA(Gln) amidotransferase subunit GatC [Chlorobium phaeovibrioides]|uniref:Aspartyl/glutamyl-tRNA(Asn/Gln) amidotransferase subunit C n=2 Tax=Chlorobium phaeovibrioides TaxID=1094 RepID=GATC_CHLPM|nr:Asp-tRNA(Asn)/Glu-tRNA(Gln) amidotransferase subunit GatC [Chlorobium phaeovibrioides]A4SD65.1 RecName: Full=Aspartyl/glutamyl-tRNA(Asn/Gln) amidotransferase subunit C; Short=Asp/Glu-ADT subunit C [Chlorobium phaeovibrioides DSM 265]HCD36726.1 Asp-tRNA(Asn)/Glu-tRNA(Gln) amidotransferase GatCAB subunit C [Chlorobium sp.]KAA6232032.1 Asp-tRNA(Asn)/Glu-tRNA(Gln) amidotransferase subunit GatC [Chlorobium phaeovibrioides]MWV54603.1 Asp-tRNA(Asn)/Glu-tRNA(Gln) amidotransferase subunit GatC [Chlor
MSVTIDDVTYIAELARLRFSDDEALKMTDELNTILHYVDTLNEVDTEGVLPLSNIHDQKNVLRADEEHEPIANAAALSNAPDSQDRFFRVPKVLG